MRSANFWLFSHREAVDHVTKMQADEIGVGPSSRSPKPAGHL
jgi:hypothetical protein